VNQNRGRKTRQLGRACLFASLPLVLGLGLTSVPQVASASTGNTVNPTWPTSLVLGSVGAENQTSLMESLAPIQDVFKQKLDVSLTVYIGTSYAADIEAQAAGKAQIVEYGPFSYTIAKYLQHLPIESVGVLLSAPHTDGGYWSYGVIDPQRTPDITGIKDFAGKKVCFSDPSSTSGYLYPSYGLLKAGINPTTGVTPVFAGTDSTTALDVAKGGCQVGFTNNFNLPEVFSENHVPKSALKIVWTSPEIPGNPVAVDTSLPASFRSALENVLVNDANSNYMAAHGYCKSVADCTNITGGWGFGPPSDANFSVVLKICQLTKAPACKLS
jgi:phosphonate transport system substrate-binding protein